MSSFIIVICCPVSVSDLGDVTTDKYLSGGKIKEAFKILLPSPGFDPEICLYLIIDTYNEIL